METQTAERLMKEDTNDWKHFSEHLRSQGTSNKYTLNLKINSK